MEEVPTTDDSPFGELLCTPEDETAAVRLRRAQQIVPGQKPTMPPRRSQGALQARYREQMRAQLGQCFFAVFSQRGFEAVTVAQLVNAVGLSRASFFRYFESKEAAVLCAWEAQGAELATALAARPTAEQPWVALRAASAQAVDRVFADREEGRARVAMVAGCAPLRQHYAGLQERWRGEIAAALVVRLGAPEVSVGIQALSATTVKLVALALRRWAAENEVEAPGRSVELAFDSLASGLGRGRPLIRPAAPSPRRAE